MRGALIAALLGACAPTQAASPVPATPAPVAAPMNVELTLDRPAVARAADLGVRVTLTNPGPEPVTLNTLYLDLPSIVLQVRRADGSPVAKGPPPMPPLDDGVTGRKVLAPGEKLELRFAGGGLFGVDPGPGAYEIGYRFTARPGPGPTDWAGPLASPWVPFTVGP